MEAKVLWKVLYGPQSAFEHQSYLQYLKKYVSASVCMLSGFSREASVCLAI